MITQNIKDLLGDGKQINEGEECMSKIAIGQNGEDGDPLKRSPRVLSGIAPLATI